MEVVAKRRALGRGLGALIPGAFEATKEAEPVEVTESPAAAAATEVPLSSIRVSRVQPRQVFSDAAIAELADSIRQKGIIQPLLVRPMGDGYELIAGERRYRAAHSLGLETVPVNVRSVDDREALELALIENVQRENLNPLEEARAYRRLVEEFHLVPEEIATRVGKDRSTVTNTMRLLQLPAAVQAQIEAGDLTAGHARALINLDSTDDIVTLAKIVVAKRLNVRQTEQLAKQKRAAISDVDHLAAERHLSEALGTKVKIALRRKGTGKIEIDYYSLDQLNGLIDRLCR